MGDGFADLRGTLDADDDEFARMSTSALSASTSHDVAEKDTSQRAAVPESEPDDDQGEWLLESSWPKGAEPVERGGDIAERETSDLSPESARPVSAEEPRVASPSRPVESWQQPATLEALEQSFASSGFQSFELRPGELAALAAQAGSAPDAPARDGVPDFAASGVTTAVEASAPPTPEPPAEPRGPAPDDYAARLNVGREHRGAGRIEDALTEYRVVLKNAPELLPEVVDELNESLSMAPDHPEVHRLLGDASIRQGDYLGALESYNRAVALTQAQNN
jgi:tetratricopeptide (TPR) repeat protein